MHIRATYQGVSGLLIGLEEGQKAQSSCGLSGRQGDMALLLLLVSLSEGGGDEDDSGG